MSPFPHLMKTFSPKRNAVALRRLLEGIRGDRKGIAAVEFAFLLPILLTMYFAVVETTQGVTADRKSALLNRAVGDLTAQAVTVDDAERDNIFNAALSVISPFNASLAAMSVASVVIDAAGVPKVCWSEGKNMAAPTTVAIPATLKIPSTSLIVSKSIYAYTPTVGYQMTGTFNLGNDPLYLRPRQGKAGPTGIQQVERTGKPLC